MPYIPPLTDSYIDETYPRLVQVSGSSFADGLGNEITFGTIDTSSLVTTSSFNSFTSSYNTGSFSGSLEGTASWATNAVSSSYPIAVTGSTLYSVAPSSVTNFDNYMTEGNIFLGSGSGYNARVITNSNFLGSYAGQSILSASYSNLFGYQVGKAIIYPPSPNLSNCIQVENLEFIDIDGSGSVNIISATVDVIIVGGNIGDVITTPYTISTLALVSGSTTINVDFTYYTSPIINNASYDSGLNQSTLRFSPSLLSEYCQIIHGSTSIGPNNIIIGTNITLEPNRQDSINIGGIIFGTGSHSNILNEPYSGSANGKVGINVVNPEYTLDVSGSGNYTDGLTITGSAYLPSLTNTSQDNLVNIDTASGQLYYSSVLNAGPIRVAGSTLYSIVPLAGPGFSTIDGLFLGYQAGYNAGGANSSAMIGPFAGSGATNANNSNFFGTYAEIGRAHV